MEANGFMNNAEVEQLTSSTLSIWRSSKRFMKNAKEIIMKLAQKESNNAEDKLNYNGNQKELIKSIENHDDISLNSIQISSNSHQANNNHLEIDLTLTESEDEQEETMPKICRYYMRKE